MRLIDLSLTIAPTISEPAPVSIEYISHEQGAYILGKSLNLQPQDFPDGFAISTEIISLTTHTGTHIDAPLHYGPDCEGVKSKSIVDVPLEWFYSNAVVLRFDPNPDLNEVSLEEVQQQLEIIQYSLKPLDIVLLQTEGDRLWGEKEYFTHFRGISKDATKWLTGQEIKVIGVDTFGFDAPFQKMLGRYQKDKDKAALWPAHIFGRQKEYCQIERLANLHLLPTQFGFKVACFPIKINDCGAGWSRVVAFLDQK